MAGPDITYYMEIILIIRYNMALIFNMVNLCVLYNTVVAAGRMRKFQGLDLARGP